MKLFKDMKFWKKIFRSRQDEEGDELDFEDESWERIESNRSKFNVHDWDQRKEYVQDCRDRIREASEELENLSFEYGKVTSYLKDIEEIEALPEEERKELNASAEKIQELESRRGAYLEKKNRMSDEKYHQMERMEDEAEEGLRKLSETEDYQNLIRKDMSRLDGEKHAYLYRKDELKGMIADAKGMTIICSVALIVCFVVLFTLKYALRMDIQVGFLLTTGLAALVITLLFIKYTESVKELKRVEKGINRIIMLHNRVKIRYVNNTNLLDLDECQQELLSILKCYQVKDPAIWLHQTAAILDNKEMVEIRHGLIIRRQSLRRRMDYNREMIIEKTKGEMKELAEAYPQYAGELGWK